MKISMRALFGVSALAFMLTATPVLAAEVKVSSDNTLTGAQSDNDNKVTLNGNGDLNVDNIATVNNNASEVTIDTGHNDQNKNTTGGDVMSGNVDVSADWNNVVNDGASLCGCTGGDNGWTVTADFSNNTTGYKSHNDNKLTINDNGDQTFTNVATILNSLSLDANTGHNDQNKNTTGGNMTTGDISLAAMFSNEANSGSKGGDPSHGSSSVDVTASNKTTGAESDNNNIVKLNNDGDTHVTNVATLTNSVDLYANTGHNDQNKNTKAGDLKTGNVGLSANITNVANNNDCACAARGSTDVMVNASNDTTGYKSDNNNKVTVNDNHDVTVTNTATVDNTVSAEANTGHNDQNMNTEAGSTSTGSVSLDLNISNTVN